MQFNREELLQVSAILCKGGGTNAVKLAIATAQELINEVDAIDASQTAEKPAESE